MNVPGREWRRWWGVRRRASRDYRHCRFQRGNLLGLLFIQTVAVFRELPLERLVQSSLLRGEFLLQLCHLIGHFCNAERTGLRKKGVNTLLQLRIPHGF
jgi:hypothetical protein